MSSESDSDFDLSFVSNAVQKTEERIKKVKSDYKINLCDNTENETKTSSDSKKSKEPSPIKKPRVPEVVCEEQTIAEKNSSEKEVSITPPSSPTMLRKDSKEEQRNRSMKTQKALLKLSSTRIRNEQIEAQSKDSTEDCIEIIGQTNRYSSSEGIEIVNIEKSIEVDLKIRWKHAIHRIRLNTSSRFGLLFDKFTAQVKENIGALIFRHQGKILYRTDSYKSLQLTVVDIIDANYVDHETREFIPEDLVELKIQSIATNSRNSSKTIKIRKSDPMECLMNTYAAQMNISPSKLTFKFEGNLIDLKNDTPESLDMEDGDCIDAFGVKVKEDVKERKLPKRKTSKQEKQREKIKHMIVIDDTMFD